MLHQTLPGTVLTCSNPDCGCRVTIEEPCPHGDTYTCACGHQFEAKGGGTAITETPPGITARG
jgi:hypothetical protein